MSPWFLQLKKFFAPGSILLLCICALNFGVGIAFVRSQRDKTEDGMRSSHRSGSLRGDRSISLTTSVPKTDPAASSTSSDPSSDVAARVKIYQAARRGIALQQVKASTVTKRTVVRINVNSQVDTEGLLRSEILAEAYQLAIRSEEPWRNLITVSAEYYRNGEKQSARDVLKAAERLAIDPDNSAKTSAAVGEVVKAMLIQRNNDDAVNALQNITNAGEREKAMSVVASWAAREGRLRIARNLIASISAGNERDSALVTIAESEASYEGANKAMRTVDTIGSTSRKNDAYRRIALKRGALRDFSEAERAVVYINDDKVKDSTLGTLAKQKARSGDLNGGLNTLMAMNDPIIADSSLRSLSDELARLGKFSTSAFVTTRINGEREKSFALEKLSVEQARSGDLVGSLMRADAITIRAVRERALRSVSSVTAGRGAPGRARNVAFSIHSAQVRDSAYRDIAAASARNGDHTAAFNTLQEIDQPQQKALALVAMARSTNKQGDRRKALALLEGAGRAAQNLTSSGEVDKIRATMAVAYAERSDSGRSLLLVKKIQDLALRDKAFKNLAQTLALNHDIRSAQSSVDSITSIPLRQAAADHVAKALAKSVPPEQAVRYSRTLSSGRQRIVFLLAVSRKI